MSMNHSKGVALVTGASGGIGAVYAERLARRGYDLILVARNQDRLLSVAGRLARETGREVETFEADLSQPGGVSRVEARLRNDPRITLLVNNAGVGATAPLLEADVDKMSELIALNANALMRLTYAAAPGFVARGGGTIINIASIVAIATERLNGVYAASKAFVLAFTQSLQSELASRGVRVQVVLPGATATEFWDVAGRPLEELPADWVMSAETLVDAALAGLDLGELVTIPALADPDEWTGYDAARRAMSGRLSASTPAERYWPRAAELDLAS